MTSSTPTTNMPQKQSGSTSLLNLPSPQLTPEELRQLTNMTEKVSAKLYEAVRIQDEAFRVLRGTTHKPHTF